MNSNKSFLRQIAGKVLRFVLSRTGGRLSWLVGVCATRYLAMLSIRSAKGWLRERSDTAAVAIRDGYILFHDSGNTLIRRGPYYEPDTREALFSLCAMAKLRGSLEIADIGANIGLHTVFLTRRFPEATIHAYDPSPQSVRYLRRTIEYNGLDRVHLHECALGAATGTVEMHTWGSESSADSLRDTQRVRGKSTTISVPLTTLDNESSAGVRPNVIKMDCEGGELDVLRGASEIFTNLRPFVFMEFSAVNIKAFGIEPLDLFKWAEEMRYRLFTEAFVLLRTPHDMVYAQVRGAENFILLPAERAS